MAAHAAAALLERGVAEAVIGGALVAVLEDLVGLVDFLELDFALGIAGILVRMPLHRQLAERCLQPSVVGSALDFKGFVVAALGGHRQTRPNFIFIPPSDAGKQMQERCSVPLNEK